IFFGFSAVLEIAGAAVDFSLPYVPIRKFARAYDFSLLVLASWCELRERTFAYSDSIGSHRSRRAKNPSLILNTAANDFLREEIEQNRHAKRRRNCRNQRKHR